jgi:hypothetical protein
MESQAALKPPLVYDRFCCLVTVNATVAGFDLEIEIANQFEGGEDFRRELDSLVFLRSRNVNAQQQQTERQNDPAIRRLQESE